MADREGRNDSGIARPNADTIVLNDMGGQQMYVTENVTGTLRAQDHGHPPLVCERYELPLAFDVRNSAVSKTNGSLQSAAKQNVNSNNVVWDVERH